MTRSIKTILIILLLCGNCYPGKSQLSFAVDNLSFCYYGDLASDKSSENTVLYSQGPDIHVCGRLVNDSREPVLIELNEEANDGMIMGKVRLSLYVSYHFREDYFFEIAPLFTPCLFMSYPFESDYCIPTKTMIMNGKWVSYSVLGAGESIPLCFETLAKPRNDGNMSNASAFRGFFHGLRSRNLQKKAGRAIKSSLEIVPIIYSEINEYEQKCFINSVAAHNEDKYDYEEMSVPQVFLDSRPFFIDGGISGFYQWLHRQITEQGLLLTQEGNQVLVVFVVDKNGDVVFVKADAMSEESEQVLKHLLKQSPKWRAGKLKGRSIDSRISLLLSISPDGSVKDISII